MRTIQGPLEARRGRVERSKSAQGRVHAVDGFVQTLGAGETTVDIEFPVSFIERPCFTFGGELGENEVLEDGNFPTISLVVKNWKLATRGGADYYVGATLIVVSTGTTTQKMIAHWKMEAVALTNPLLSTGSADDPI